MWRLKLLFFLPFYGLTWFRKRWALQTRAKALGVDPDDLEFRESVARYFAAMEKLDRQQRLVMRRIDSLEQTFRTPPAVEKGWIEKATPSKS